MMGVVFTGRAFSNASEHPYPQWADDIDELRWVLDRPGPPQSI
jgi:hypothetical protein